MAQHSEESFFDGQVEIGEIDAVHGHPAVHQWTCTVVIPAGQRKTKFGGSGSLGHGLMGKERGSAGGDEEAASHWISGGWLAAVLGFAFAAGGHIGFHYRTSGRERIGF